MVENVAASTGNVSEERVFDERKQKVLHYLKHNWNLITYVVLAILVYLAVKIRTLNLPGLKDITTGGWTLGPDLDPFLFLRWAQYMVDHGALMAIDTMRYVPLGYDTTQELWLHPYLMVLFHKIASMFGATDLTHSAVLYPAFMFGAGMIAFFFMTRKIFVERMGEKNSNIIALIATFFLSIYPALLPRTIAGIPEKEASALVFMFLAFYFFICSWKSKQKLGTYAFAILAGLSTGLMGLVWGGYIYVTISLALATFIAFILGKTNKERFFAYVIWLALFVILMIGLTQRFTLKDLLLSTSILPALFVLVLLLVDLVLFETPAKHRLKKITHSQKVPRVVVSILATIILGLVGISVLFGPGWSLQKIASLKNNLVTPVADRLGVTVAENRQPFFTEWASSFGPYIRGFPVTFWFMFFGGILLFYSALAHFGKQRVRFTLAFALFLISLIFSRYSGSSQLNGTNMISILFYMLGPLVLLGVFGYSYFKDSQHEESRAKYRDIDFALICFLSFFVISLVSARSAVRLIMMLVPAASIMLGYFSVALVDSARSTKDSFWRIVRWIVAIAVLLLLVVAANQLYNETKATAQAYVPSIYTQQWQKGMAWVRNETPQNAVFGHWWDYGFWVQTIGERATVLDGGNARPYWNHMMGRYALTGANETEALEFLYAHNTTHFLIDSTDIGKYSAFSTIGSDANYDRSSFIPAFLRDSAQTQEKKNSTVHVYAGGVGLDGDIIYEINGTRIFLPAGQAGLAAILIEKNRNDTIVGNPIGVFVYQGQQYTIPLRYVYDSRLIDLGSGLDAGIFLMPRVDQQGNSIQVEQDGALLYLSSRVVHSQLARLYLYKEQDPYFELVHTEDDFVVDSIKSQGGLIENDLTYFGGVRGPIRIWEIHYPSKTVFKEAYLSEVYPEELLRA